jgi:hypothetical protein
VGPAFDSAEGVGLAERPAAFLAEGYFSGFDDDPRSPRQRGPGDSNYELTFTLRDLGGDSSGDWDAATPQVEPEAPSSDEVEALAPTTTAPHEPDSWHVHFIRSWGLVIIGAALGLIAVSVPVIAYLVWRTLAADMPLGTPLSTLIAGFTCAVALLMISIPLMLLAICLTDLARDVRRLREHLERKTGPGG